MLICLFYLSVILEIMGAAILQLPVTADSVRIGQLFGISLALFAVLYGIYFAAARTCYGHTGRDDL